MKQLKSAANDYWHRFWPCDETKPGYGQCVNGRDGHPHHQFRHGGGADNGDYRTSDTLEKLQKHLESEIGKRVKELHSDADADQTRLQKLGYEECVSRAHRRKMTEFYRGMKNLESFSSHSVCFSCLDAAPEHSLPCGHVICTPCIVSAASDDEQEQALLLGGGFVLLGSCPLASHGELWAEPWVGSIKPDQAGVRIMTLDG
jgi:hypothetical protein